MSDIHDQDDVEKIFTTCRDQAVELFDRAPWLLSSMKDRAELLVYEIVALEHPQEPAGRNDTVAQTNRSSQGATSATWRPADYSARVASNPPLHQIDPASSAPVAQEHTRSRIRNAGGIEEESGDVPRESSRSAESTHESSERRAGHTIIGAVSQSAEEEFVAEPPSSTTSADIAHAADGMVDTVREESNVERSVGNKSVRASQDPQAGENVFSLMEKHAADSQDEHDLGVVIGENDVQELVPASATAMVQNVLHDPTRAVSSDGLSERNSENVQDGMQELSVLQAAAQTTQLQSAQEVGQVEARQLEAPGGIIRAGTGETPGETPGKTPRVTLKEIRKGIPGDTPGETGQEETRQGEAREEEAQRHEAQEAVQETSPESELQGEAQQREAQLGKQERVSSSNQSAHGEAQAFQSDNEWQSQACAGSRPGPEETVQVPLSLGGTTELDQTTQTDTNDTSSDSARDRNSIRNEDDTDKSSTRAEEEQVSQQSDADSSDDIVVIDRSHAGPDWKASASSNSRRGRYLRSNEKDDSAKGNWMGIGKRSTNQPPKTPSKRRKLVEDPDTQLARMEIRDLPKGLIRPTAASKLIAKLMDENDMRATSALTCLFFGIASPHALGLLRRACESVRNVQRPEIGLEDSQVLASTRALDLMDTQEQILPILRRYHLQQLLQYREERQKHHHSLLQNGKSRKPKHVLRKRTSSSIAAGTKIAAGAALKDTMRQAYPELQLVPSRNNPEYQRRFKVLQNRLSAGRNWHMLERKFGIGILALVPVGNGLTNADVEKTQHHVFDNFVNILQQHRGEVLTMMSENLSENIYEILLGRNGDLTFDLEIVHQHELISRPYDSPALLRSCQRVQYQENSDGILSS